MCFSNKNSVPRYSYFKNAYESQNHRMFQQANEDLYTVEDFLSEKFGYVKAQVIEKDGRDLKPL